MTLLGVGALAVLLLRVFSFPGPGPSVGAAGSPDSAPRLAPPDRPRGLPAVPPPHAERNSGPVPASPVAALPVPAPSAGPAPAIAARQARAADARWLRDDWDAQLGALAREAPERRHAALAEWRQRHAAAIAAVEGELGGVLAFPESPGDIPATGPLPLPARVAAARPPSPEARAFLDERDLLTAERRAVTDRTDLPEPERLQLLAAWEQDNEERLRNHRLLALTLGLLNVELLESEVQAHRPAPNP